MKNTRLGTSSKSAIPRIFLTKKQKVNEGEVPQYYIDTATKPLSIRLNGMPCRKKSGAEKKSAELTAAQACSAQNWSAEIAAAGTDTKTWHSTDKYRSTIWCCNQKYSDGKRIDAALGCYRRRYKGQIYFGVQPYRFFQKPYIKACRTAKQALTDTTSIDTEMADLLRKIEVVSELTRKCIEKNSAVAQDQKEFNSRYNGYVEKYEALKERYDSLAAERERKNRNGKSHRQVYSHR